MILQLEQKEQCHGILLERQCLSAVKALYDIKTELSFRANRWTPLPMPGVIIDCMNKFVAADELIIGSKHKDKKPAAVTKATKGKKSKDQVLPQTEPSVEAVIRVPTPHIPPEFADFGLFEDDQPEYSVNDTHQ